MSLFKCDHCGSHLAEPPPKDPQDFRKEAVVILDELDTGRFKDFYQVMDKIEQACIDLALEETKHIVAHAARVLRMNRTTLAQRLSARRLKKYLAMDSAAEAQAQPEAEHPDHDKNH